jgi:hypothetical protein
MTEYEKGWNDAFETITKYVAAEVCLVTAEMIKRMKHETWRTGVVNEKASNSNYNDKSASAG